MRQLGARAVHGVVDAGKQIFQIDAAAHRDDLIEDAREDFALGVAVRVVGMQEGAAVEEQPRAERAPTDDAVQIIRVVEFRPGLEDGGGTEPDMFERGRFAGGPWSQFEPAAALMGVAGQRLLHG